MKWFKHYTNASKGEIIHTLQAEFGHAKGHGLYFLFIEYLVDKWDGCSEPNFTFSTKNLRKYLALSPEKFNKFIQIVSDSFQIFFKNNSEFIDISFPKLLEVMNKDAMSSTSRPARWPATGRQDKNREEEEKEKNTLSLVQEFFDADQLMTAMPHEVKLKWGKRYPDQQWLVEQVDLAFTYHTTDPLTTPRTVGAWIKKLHSWFYAGWPKRKKAFRSTVTGFADV